MEALEKHKFFAYLFFIWGGFTRDKRMLQLDYRKCLHMQRLESKGLYSPDTGSWEIWRGYIFVPF